MNVNNPDFSLVLAGVRSTPDELLPYTGQVVVDGSAPGIGRWSAGTGRPVPQDPGLGD